MKALSKNKHVIKGLFVVQLLFLYLPTLELFSIPTDNGSIPASLCYFFSLVFAPFLLYRIRELRLPPWYITALTAYVFVLAAIRIPAYGLSKSILHWAFGFYLLVVLLNVGAVLEREDWLRLLEVGAVCFAAAHFLYMLLNWQTCVWLLRGYFDGTLSGSYGATLPSLTRGGRNLDCTWLALGGFFVRGKKKAVYTTYAILFSFLGCSRVGVIACGLLVLWSLLYDPLYKLSARNVKFWLLYAAALLLVLFGSGAAQAFLGRSLIALPAPAVLLGRQPPLAVEASSQGDEQNLTVFLSGRAAIWSTVPQMVKDNPFGYGVGNAMRVMKQSYGFTSYEDVIHNVFLQWTVDEGILGGL